MSISAKPNEPDRPIFSIADQYWDLLAELDEGRRLGMIRRLAVGFYEGWTPSRAEVAVLVDFELGRIGAAEFFATKQEPEAIGRAAAAAGQQQVRTRDEEGTRRNRPRTLTTFRTDCGELAPPFRLIASGLTSAGWTVRDGKRYRLMALHYQLVPPIAPRPVRVTPVLFTATIRCVPDVTAPWADEDGRFRRHSVRPTGISGSRGLWPIAEEADNVTFVITGQSAPGTRPGHHPTGTLRVNIAGSSGTWRQVG